MFLMIHRLSLMRVEGECVSPLLILLTVSLAALLCSPASMSVSVPPSLPGGGEKSHSNTDHSSGATALSAFRREPIIRHCTPCCDLRGQNLIPRHGNKRHKRNVSDQAEKEAKDFSSFKFCSQSPHRIWLGEQSVCRSSKTVEVSGWISSWN